LPAFAARDRVLQHPGADAAPLQTRRDEELLEEELAVALGNLHPADVLSAEADDTGLAGFEPRIEARPLLGFVPGEHARRHRPHIPEIERAREPHVVDGGGTQRELHVRGSIHR
jgi:hypothetical protein